MREYRAVKAGETRTTIEKSVFLTYTRPIADEAEAQAFIRELRDRHADATHVCYGYVADPAGAIHRFSDDGEPSGTAGMPILEVVKNNGLRCSLIAVVRWFGGIKLGAGGLTRAYSGCAAAAVRAAGETVYREADAYEIATDFAGCNKIKKIPSHLLCKIDAIEYNSTVCLQVYGTENLPQAVAEVTAGRAMVEHKGKRFVCID